MSKKSKKWIDTTEMPDDTLLPGHMYTLGEQRAVLAKMHDLNQRFYAQVFDAGMGGRCHAFVEFCGLQAAFITMCRTALNNGIEFAHANQHSGNDWPLDGHNVQYLAEKFKCIYGFALAHDPELRALFIRDALGTEPKKEPTGI